VLPSILTNLIHIEETNQKRKFHAAFSECTTLFCFHDTSIFIKLNGLKFTYFIIYTVVHLGERRCMKNAYFPEYISSTQKCSQDYRFMTKKYVER
jgi:hypothetical protein